MAPKLDALLAKKSQIEARIKAEQQKQKTKARKYDTRRKILAGAAILARVEAGEFDKAEFRNIMDGFLTKKLDRELFDLEPKPPK